MNGFLEYRGVSKRFGRVRAVEGVDLAIRRGEFFSLLGPSGCGKTTMLRLAGGFEAPDEGRIFLQDRDITPLPPNRRQVNTIFQSYALFPHLTVRENIAFGPRTAGRSRAEVAEAVAAMLRLIRMEDLSDKKPATLSGGQKQRVAVARALVNRPDVLLLDEPLAALDLKLRQRMLLELDAIHREVGITFLYVTHDQGEAMSASDRIAVMNEGRIEQVGTPAEIYEAPRTEFVAAFIGDTNFLEGTASRSAGEGPLRIRVAGLPDLAAPSGRPVPADGRVRLGVRPERIRLSRLRPEPGPGENVLGGIIEEAVYLGSSTRYLVGAGGHRIQAVRQQTRSKPDEPPLRRGDEVWLSWAGEDGFVVGGES